MIRLEQLGDGVVSLVFDRPEGEHNFQDTSSVKQLQKLIDEIIKNTSVKGVIITSAKTNSFLVGGDLDELQSIKSPHNAQKVIENIHAVLRAIELSNIPFVAAINGLALGGGLELALACNYRIGVNESHLKLGLPEVSLGLMPGAGGTQRLPRLIGLSAALPILVKGKKVNAKEALKIGLLDECVGSGALLSQAKKAVLSESVPILQPWDNHSNPHNSRKENSDFSANLFKQFWTEINKTKKGLEPAPSKILETVELGLLKSIDSGLKIEIKAFSELVVTSAAKNKIRTMFYALNNANKFRNRPQEVPPYNVSRIAVLGGGLMGSGISYCAAFAGIDVLLLDLSKELLVKARQSIEKKTASAQNSGIISNSAAKRLLSRVKFITNYELISDVDIVIEAVSEVEATKKSVIEKASLTIKSSVPIATNTSTIPIHVLSNSMKIPENLVGLHFFAPVDRMRLVEVVKGVRTSPATMASALDFVANLKKTPIVVNDGPGFFTSRVVASYTGEALTLLYEGIPAKIIDSVAIKAGMPIGPLTMADATSLPLLKDIFVSIIGDGTRIGVKQMKAVEVLNRLINDFGRNGKESGSGIFDYNTSGQHEWSNLGECFPQINNKPNLDIIEKRMLNAQGLEAVRALEEKVINTSSEADLASVLGWGFPSSYGGVIGYIDTVGISCFVDQCDMLTEQCGARFMVPNLLRDMAKENKCFYSN